MINCNCLGTKQQQIELEKILFLFKKDKWTTVKLLASIQNVYGYLPEGVLTFVASKTQIPLTELYSIGSFYAQFSFVPSGKFVVSVCLGTACYVKGSQEILDKVCELLSVKVGETTIDKLFTVDETRCLGCCGMAPVLTIGSDVYGNVKIEEVKSILDKYREK